MTNFKYVQFGISACLLFISLCAFSDPIEAVKLALVQKDYKESFNLAKPLADAGNPEAMGIVGKLMIRGAGVQKNTKEGLKLISSAADAGDAKSQAILSFFLEGNDPEYGLVKNYERAFQLALASAEQGNSDGKSMLGRKLVFAIGTQRDLSRGMSFLEESAKEGNRLSQLTLGSLLAIGIGAHDSERGKQLLEMAAAQLGDDETKNSVARILKFNNELTRWINGDYTITESSPWAAGANLRLMKMFYDQSRWPELAALVIEVNDNQDLSYFF